MPSRPQGHRTVVITGASGFIGRRCFARLLEEGYDVHALSSRPGEAERGSAATWYRVDLLAPGAAAALVNRLRPTHLLHLAWCARPGEFWMSEDNFRWLTASQELFRTFYAAGGRRAVGAGTCAEYEWSEADCDEERTPLRPDTIYGRCKLAASLVLEAAVAGGGSAAWGRIFFPYGPGEPAGRFLPALIRGLLRGEEVACSHGRQVRDFTYVDDVAGGLVALLAAEATGAFNIATGRGTSLRELAERVTARLGRAELVRFGTRAALPGDPPRVVADMTRTKSATGWAAAMGLDEGIDRAIAAWRERLHFEEDR
jgi:nucleoside-diphosphate-sugar epimerase